MQKLPLQLENEVLLVGLGIALLALLVEPLGIRVPLAVAHAGVQAPAVVDTVARGVGIPAAPLPAWKLHVVLP